VATCSQYHESEFVLRSPTTNTTYIESIEAGYLLPLPSRLLGLFPFGRHRDVSTIVSLEGSWARMDRLKRKMEQS
jgi:hypothetical protein